MSRQWFITDIHGEYAGILRLLEFVRFDPSADRIVFGGDLVGRGPDSGPVLREVRRLQRLHPESVRAVAGNHEEMMLGYFRDGDALWLHHGGREALRSFREEFPDPETLNEHVDWAAGLPLVIGDDEYVYAHAGIEPDKELAAQSREIVWMEEDVLYGYPRSELLRATGGRPVVHGHTPCEFIYFDGVRLNGDLGAHTYSVREEQALGLIDLAHLEYYVYKLHSRRIEKRRIQTFG